MNPRRAMAHTAALAVTLIAAASLTATQALAETCWTPQAVGAARLSELDTLLMTSSLRCERIGVPNMADYEKLTTTYAAAFHAAETQVRAHFDDATQRGAFDAYSVGMANYYGTGRTDVITCQKLGMVERALTGPGGTEDMLDTVAFQMIRDPHVAPHCPPGYRPPAVSATTHLAEQRPTPQP